MAQALSQVLMHARDLHRPLMNDRFLNSPRSNSKECRTPRSKKAKSAQNDSIYQEAPSKHGLWCDWEKVGWSWFPKIWEKLEIRKDNQSSYCATAMNSISSYTSAKDWLQKLLSTYRKGVHSGHRVGFGLGVTDWFGIRFCIHIVFYIIVNHIWRRVKSSSNTRSGKFRIIGSVLNTSTYS